MRRALVAGLVALAVILVAGAIALASGGGTLASAPDRRSVEAPIDDVQVVIRETQPPQVTLKVTAGLPSGCAKAEAYTVERAGQTITVRVMNSMPAGDPICTMIYGTYELNIDLGRDFTPGTTYTVRVNDTTTTFKT